MQDRDTAIDKIMGELTLEQKAGQLFTQAFYGSSVTPDNIRTIRDLNCGGLRITQYFRGFRRYARPGEDAHAFEKVSPADLTPCLIDDRKDLLCPAPYLTIEQYARVLDAAKQVAEDRPYHIPLHMMLDQEGGGSFDCMRGGMRYFPAPFGYARTGDKELVEAIARATATQLSAIGFNMINSPCVDICFDPAATYIRTRAFGAGVKHVCEMASAALKGYTESGLIACAKHFPGRGATVVDAHHDVGAIDKSDEALWNEDLAPYRRLIAEGLGAIMVGHSIYPAWDADNLASVSDAVINGILRERLQFKGIVATDSMIMGAIAKKYGVPQGCLIAIKAGASAVLMKECGPIREEAYRLVIEAIKSGDISEAHVDDLVMRNLRVKFDHGLFGDRYRPDPAAAETVVRSPELARIEIRAAETAVHVVRDEDGLLPLPADRRTLVVEQVPIQHVRCNDYWVHPGMFWEQILQHTEMASLIEVENNPTDEDLDKLRQYLGFYDCVILTFYKDKNNIGSGNLIEAALEAGKQVVVVSSTPLPYDLPAEWPTVICTYGIMTPSLKAAADLIYGALVPVKKREPAPWEMNA